MTRQEIFTTVKNHLLKQGAKSLDSHGKCAYRGVNGAMCAVGVLIKNEFYEPTIEGWPVDDLGVCAALRKSGIDVAENSFLLSKLQEIHDFQDVKKWKSKLGKLAEHYGLAFYT